MKIREKKPISPTRKENRQHTIIINQKYKEDEELEASNDADDMAWRERIALSGLDDLFVQPRDTPQDEQRRVALTYKRSLRPMENIRARRDAPMERDTGVRRTGVKAL